MHDANGQQKARSDDALHDACQFINQAMLPTCISVTWIHFGADYKSMLPIRAKQQHNWSCAWLIDYDK